MTNPTQDAERVAREVLETTTDGSHEEQGRHPGFILASRAIRAMLAFAAFRDRPTEGGVVDFDSRLSALCDEEWKFHAGPPPAYESPLSQVYDAGIGYAWERLAELLGVTDYEGGDGSEDYATDVMNTGRNILVAAGYTNADGDLLPGAAPRPTDGGVVRVKRAIELYADSYAMMSRMGGDGKVSCTSVEYDLRRNVVDSVLASLQAGEAEPTAAILSRGPLVGYLIYDERGEGEEFSRFQLTNADLAAGFTQKPVYFAGKAYGSATPNHPAHSGDDWRMVPAVPAEAMLRAYSDCPYEGPEDKWRAMLASAPQPLPAHGVITAGEVFLVSLGLSKPGYGCVTYCMSQSWRMGGTEQEAIDAAISFAAKEKPGFGVWEKLITRVPLTLAALNPSQERAER